MRKNVVGICLTVLLFTGCGAVGEVEIDVENSTSIQDEAVQSEQSSIDVAPEKEEAGVIHEYIPTSQEAQTIEYQGDLIIKCMAVDQNTNTIYLSGKDVEGVYRIHTMEPGSVTSVATEIEVPEDRMVRAMCCDQEGKLHFFLSDTGALASTYEIWVTDGSANVLKKMDITSEWGTQRGGVAAFTIDALGNYYLRGTMLWEEAALVLGENGDLLHSLSLEESLYVRGAVGRGNDGKVYAGAVDDKDQIQLLLLDGVSGTVSKVNQAELAGCNSMIGCVMGGTDTDLLWYGAGCGLYAYSMETDVAELRMSVAELPTDVEGISVCSFLADGRFLYMKGSYDQALMDTEQDIQQAKGTMFFYVPAGR